MTQRVTGKVNVTTAIPQHCELQTCLADKISLVSSVLSKLELTANFVDHIALVTHFDEVKDG